MIFGITSLSNQTNLESYYTEAIEKDLVQKNFRLIKDPDGNYVFARLQRNILDGYEGVFTDKECVSLLYGEPLLGESSLEKDHKELSTALFENKYVKFKNSRGQFSLINYEGSRFKKVVLAADKFAIRPLYYWTDGDVAVFSTSIDMIKSLPFVKTEIDYDSFAERLALGYPLGRNTEYKNIFCLKSAEIVTISHEGIKNDQYFEWGHIPQAANFDEQFCRDVYDLFLDSISIRLRGESTAFTFLSGGMDSRALVGALVDLGVNVPTLNFSPDSSQDLVYAKQFAEEINTPFKWVCRAPSVKLDDIKSIALEWMRGERIEASPKQFRPDIIWSGNGGSVGVGCVYLNEEIVNTARKKGVEDAVLKYLTYNKITLPLKSFTKKWKYHFSDYLLNNISTEVKAIDCEDKGQALFLYLMHNDQRRHCYDFYEKLNEYSIEYQMPFFDGLFLEKLFSLPLDFRLNHRFYHQWYNCFPRAVKAVPWQTYPGHLPCPVKCDLDLDYQWNKPDRSYIYSFSDRYKEFTEGLTLVAKKDNLGPYSRYKMAFGLLAHILGVRDYEYLISGMRRFIYFYEN